MDVKISWLIIRIRKNLSCISNSNNRQQGTAFGIFERRFYYNYTYSIGIVDKYIAKNYFCKLFLKKS